MWRQICRHGPWLALVVAGPLLTGCASGPPDRPDNACLIFEEKADWYEAATAVEKKWSLPIQVQLAIIRQESSFRHDAKPPRASFLGIPMWWRQSSAYGYAQALDSTWDWYRDSTGNRWASRRNFDDAVDFVGWYSEVSRRKLGISKWDGYNQYLAYHEGHGGWRRKTYRDKPWLIRVARQVDTEARRYGEQLRGCRDRLDDDSSWWPF